MRARLAATLLFLGAFLLYARSLGGGFVNFDDTTVLLSHPQLYDETSLWASLRQIFVDAFPREEPLLLRDVTWAVDARLFGFANPLGYHLGNVLLHAGNVVLLFLFLLRATGRFALAAWVAALFALVPIHVEPVSWVMGRKDVLSAAFVLLALLAQDAELRCDPEQSERSAQSRGRRRRLWWLGLLFTGLALLSKMGAIACFLLLGLHRLFHRDLGGSHAAGEPGEPFAWRDAPRRLAPLLPHALLTGAVVVWFGRIVGAYGVTGWRGPAPTDPTHLWNVLRFAPLSLAHYVKQTFWPSQLSLYYRWPHVEIPLTPWEAAGSALIAAVLAVAVLQCLRHRRDLAFFALAFLACALPYLNLVYIGIWKADRYAYLSSACLLAIAVTLLLEARERAGPRGRLAMTAALLAFALASGAYTFRHQGVWRDDESLWRYEAYRNEPSLLGIQGLAKNLLKQAEAAAARGDLARRDALAAEARAEIARGFERERALGRVPAPYATSEQLQLARFHYLLGRIDRLEQAPVARQIEHYERSHELAPNRANTLMLAGAYYDLAASRTDAPPAEQEQLLNRSLDYFLEYVDYSSADPLLREQSLALLEQNYASVPFLRDRVRQARGSDG